MPEVKEGEALLKVRYVGTQGREDSLKAKEEKSKEKTLNGHPFD